ncbi:hypothetical protein BDQ12DRAFT_727089 [Crucibulum laeve]|uniref:Uncharacterized protein n=1 Tax=Crucibulum laeve TaxID=68775 RepID=A0A5C3LMZ6_9AGAR|nr:hypothetical protein BDQ12DRAFT_727089 [Crucibulum laeve]
MFSLASPTLLPTAILNGRKKDSVSENGSMSIRTSTRQRERNGTIVPNPSSLSAATAISPATERIHNGSSSSWLATRSMSAASANSSSSTSSYNSRDSTMAPSEAGILITSDDDEATTPRYSKHPHLRLAGWTYRASPRALIPTPRAGVVPVLSSRPAFTDPSHRSAATSSALSSTSVHRPNQTLPEVQI